MTYIQMNDIPGCLFVNMDETAIYFDTPHNTAVNVIGAKTVSVRRGSSSTQRCMLCITVAADGAKLPLFVIFKARPNGTIAKNLRQILLKRMDACRRKVGLTIALRAFGRKKCGILTYREVQICSFTGCDRNSHTQ